MRLQPLGPAGVNQRIAELEAKISSLGGRDKKNSSTLAPVAPVGQSEFEGALGGAIGNASGQIAPLRPNMGELMPTNELSATTFRPMIQAAAERHGVDPQLLEALVSVESNFNPRATSGVGAAGLTQLMPGTARALGVTDPYDPQQSLNGGAKYLKQMLDQFGDLPTALAAYNAGPGNVRKYGGIPPFAETQNYVQKVQSKYGILASNTGQSR